MIAVRRPFPTDRLRDSLLTLLGGVALMVLPFLTGLGQTSGWLVGVPAFAGFLLVLNGIAGFTDLPIQVSHWLQRILGVVLLVAALLLWSATPSPDAPPFLQSAALKTYGGALGVLGLFALGSGSMRKAVSYWLLSMLAVILFAPFVWMVLVSLHPPKSPIPSLADIVPKVEQPVLSATGQPVMENGEPKTVEVVKPSWSNYDLVINSPTLPVGRFFFNTVFVTVTTVILQLLITSLAAYGLSRLRWKGRDLVFALFIGSMMFAGPVTQIPVYMMLKNLGWLDTYLALIVPGVSSAFSVFLLRQFFLQIPFELDEAAKLDGAGDWTVYSRVIVPLSKPALATAGAFTFFGVWTDFFGPLIYTNSTHMRTLEVGLSIFKNSYGGTNWPLQMTAAVVVLLPLLVVFLFVQRFFVRGILLGSIK